MSHASLQTSPPGSVRVVSSRFYRVLGFLLTDCTPYQAVHCRLDNPAHPQPGELLPVETLDWVRVTLADGDAIVCLRAATGSRIWRCPSFIPL